MKQFFLVVVALFSIALMVFINQMTIIVRLEELQDALKYSEKKESNIDYLTLVTRYGVLKKQYEGNMGLAEADRVDFRLKLLTQEENREKVKSETIVDRLSLPSLYLINLLRKISGSDPIRKKDTDENELLSHIEVAYYYERNAHHAEALKSYSEATKLPGYPTGDEHLKTSISLHKGFNHAIIGENMSARDEYNSVVSTQPGTKAAVTATVLLNYLDLFQKERERVQKQENSVEKGKRLYLLIDYSGALDVLENLSASEGSDDPQLHYFKGKCLEGLNRKKEAVLVYQKIVDDNPESEYASSANRNIYKIGVLSAEGQGLMKLAEKNNAILQDAAFEELQGLEKKFSRKDIRSSTLASGAEPILSLEEIEEISESAAQKPRYMVKTREGDIIIGTIGSETSTSITFNTIIGSIRVSKRSIREQRDID